MNEQFERLGDEVRFEGGVIRAGSARFRYADGTEVRRDKVWHPGAVGIIALDDDHVWLARQPREVIGDPASLEVPAGKLDIPGEPPLETAKRELAEEIGKRAERWEELFVFYTSPGFSDERIEIVPWPLARLDEAIRQCEDSKSLIALLWLAAGRPR